ncbi:UbiA prenyltransferase family-domain-containing protein [Trametes elegans]|nr:UbiA prenyltransferase family-domain-containing protein [Trametes elegans]
MHSGLLTFSDPTRTALRVPVVRTSNILSSTLSALRKNVLSHAYTLILFTFSDVKTILIPISVFACATAPISSAAHLLPAVSWLWIHQLTCNVSNQARSCAEDAANKPWRPLPSGRISESQAIRLRWLTVALSLSLSAAYDADLLLITSVFITLTYLYDELGLAGHWLGKSFCNIGAYVTLEIGTTKLMGISQSLDTVSITAVCLSGLLILTTIQVQDFPDVDGDSALGRVTLPIYAPEASRAATLAALVGWSAALAWLWGVGPICACAFVALGTCVGVRCYVLRRPCADKRTYVLYNIWLTLANVMPMHARQNAFGF